MGNLRERKRKFDKKKKKKRKKKQMMKTKKKKRKKKKKNSCHAKNVVRFIANAIDKYRAPVAFLEVQSAVSTKTKKNERKTFFFFFFDWNEKVREDFFLFFVFAFAQFGNKVSQVCVRLRKKRRGLFCVRVLNGKRIEAYAVCWWFFQSQSKRPE
jgi:hypothetical protein